MDLSDSDSNDYWSGDDDVSEDDSVEFQSGEESDVEDIDVEATVNTAPDGTQWFIDAPNLGQAPRQNIRNLRNRPAGPKSNAARNANTILEAWSLFLTPNILDIVYLHTLNASVIYKQTHPDTCYSNINFDREDLLAYIGLRYKIGKDRNQRIPCNTLWDKQLGDTLCKATMSRNKFQFIHSVLRFDDYETRLQRRQNDCFAAVREVHTLFSNNCTLHWTPHTHATVDEQILSFRGNCPIKIYDPSKPDRYGIKMYLICDSDNQYVFSIDPYVRGQAPEPQYYSGTNVLKRLVDSADLPQGCGVVCDRFFGDYLLVDWCLQRNLSVLCTLRNDKRCVPASMRRQHLEGNPERYSRTLFRPNCTISAYIPPRHAERNFKSVLVLSSEHLDASIDGDTGKPLSIITYNKMKPGVDMLSWCCKQYDVKKCTRRWTKRVFDQILNIAAYNAWIVFRHNRPNVFPGVRQGGRKLFLESLAKELVTSTLRARALTGQRLPLEVKNCLALYGHPVLRPPPAPHPNNLRQLCHICPPARRRRSKQQCNLCGLSVCGEHSVVQRQCESCLNE